MTDVIPVKRRDATSLGEFVAGDQIPAQYVGGLIGKNLLINAEGMINQRGFAGGVLAAGIYGYDRFKAGTGGCNFSISAGIWTHTSGPVVQVVEAPSGVYGANVAFSVEDPSATISVSVGGVSGTITAGSGRQGVTLTIPSGSGNLTVQWSATNATYKCPQLERGDTATAFEYRPIGLELLLCQRYYLQFLPWGDGINTNAYTQGAFQSFPINFPTPMRATPAASLDSTNWQFGEVDTVTGIVLSPTTYGCRLLIRSLSDTKNMYIDWSSINAGHFKFDAEL